MIIMTEYGWRNWQQGVVNIDGHAIPTGENNTTIARVFRDKNGYEMLVRQLTIESPKQAASYRYRFLTRLCLMAQNGTAKRMADGRTIVQLKYSNYIS